MKTAFKLTEFTLGIFALMSIIYVGTLNSQIDNVIAKQVRKDQAAKIERYASVLTPFAQAMVADVRGGK